MKKKVRIIIHVGGTKCGSTTIQNIFSSLSLKSVFYVGRKPSINGIKEFYIDGLESIHEKIFKPARMEIEPFSPSYKGDNINLLLFQYGQVLGNLIRAPGSQVDTLILSDECFSDNTNYTAEINLFRLMGLIKNFARQFDGASDFDLCVTLLYVGRHPVDWLHSRLRYAPHQGLGNSVNLVCQDPRSSDFRDILHGDSVKTLKNLCESCLWSLKVMDLGDFSGCEDEFLAEILELCGLDANSASLPRNIDLGMNSGAEHAKKFEESFFLTNFRMLRVIGSILKRNVPSGGFNRIIILAMKRFVTQFPFCRPLDSENSCNERSAEKKIISEVLLKNNVICNDWSDFRKQINFLNIKNKRSSGS